MSGKRVCCILIVSLFVLVTVCAVVLIFTSASGNELSALSNGSGTEQDPYRISTSDQLNNLQELSTGAYAKEFTANKYFVITRDLTTYAYPLSSPYGFGGHLDGQGHTVTVKGQGLFYRMTSNSVLTNLNIKADLRLTHTSKYGVCYYLESNATISHCTVTGDMILDTNKINDNTNSPYLSASPFVICNNGLISECNYVGKIYMSGKGLSVAPKSFFLGCFSATDSNKIYNGNDSGKVVNCTAKADVTVDYVPIAEDSNSFFYMVGGISVQSQTDNCLFEGNIRLNVPANCEKDPNFTIYLLSPYAQNSKFEGDAICDYNGNAASGTIKLSSYDNCTHEGEIKLLNGLR